MDIFIKTSSFKVKIKFNRSWLNVLFVSISVPLSSSGQSLGNIYGYLTDSNLSTPIAYANVRFLKSANRTMTNTEGRFILDLQNESIEDTLNVSCVGYKTLKLPLKLIITNNIRNFKLESSTITLAEVVISPIRIEEILKAAVKFSSEQIKLPVIFNGYYRESVKRDSMMTKYADGIVHYNVLRNRKEELACEVYVAQSRSKELPVPKEEEKLNQLNTPISVSKIIRFLNPDVCAVLDSNLFSHYNYSIIELNDNGKELYKIDFQPKQGSQEALFVGRVFIDKEQQLILAVDYQVAKGAEKLLKSVNFLGIRVSAIAAGLTVRYAKIKGNYQLHYVRESHGIQISSKRINQKNSFVSEYFVSNVSIGGDWPYRENYNKRNLFKRGNLFNYDFWENSEWSPNTKGEEDFIKN